MSRTEPLGPAYRRLWTAATASYLGDGVFLTALPLLAVAATPDPAGVTIVTTAGSLPWLLFALASGAVADRTARIRLMWRVDLARAVIAGILAAALLSDHRTIPVLAAAAFALGCSETLFDTASQAVLPDLVSDDPTHLTRANGRLEAANVTANQFAGPPLGGVLYAIAPALPVLVNAASFALSAGTLRTIRTPPPAATHERPPIRTDIAEGVSWLWRHHRLRSLAVAVGAMNMALTASFAFLVLLTTEHLHLGPTSYGILLAVAALGSTAAGLTLPALTRHIPAEHVITATPALLGVALIAIAAHPTTPVVAAALTVTGYGATSWNILTVTYRQSVVPGRLLGRVNSVYRLIAYGTAPLGAIGGGLLASTTSVRTPYLAGGLLLLATSAIAAPPRRQPPAHDHTAPGE